MPDADRMTCARSRCGPGHIILNMGDPLQKSFFRVGRQTAVAVVIALVAALLSAVVSSPAQAVDNRRAVTALLRLSSGTVTDGYVTVYKEAADPLDGYQYYTD